MKPLSLFFAALLLLTLAACGGTDTGYQTVCPPPPESQSPESVPAPEDAGPAILFAAEGVTARTLLPEANQHIDPTLLAWEGRLLAVVEDLEAGGKQLLGFNLENGAQEALFPLPGEKWELRRVPGAAWEIKIFSKDSYQHSAWTQSMEGYTLPPELREGRKYRAGAFDWDALPEKDLLTWTDDAGLWLAGADGSNPRLVLATEAIGQQPEFAGLVERMQSQPPEAGVTFHNPRLMNGGQAIGVDLGSGMAQISHEGLAVIDLAAGTTRWYDVFRAYEAEDLEYLDDTTILAGVTRIDVITGETSPASRREATGRFSGITGDFVHYFASDEEGGNLALYRFTPGESGDPVLLLTLPKCQTPGDGGYERFFPAAVDGNRVVCQFTRNSQDGLAVVTLPEE